MSKSGVATSLVMCIAAVAFLAACSSATSGTAARSCDIAAADSALVRDAPLYRDCAVDRQARALETRLQSPSSMRPTSTTCFTAEVQFVVGADGHPEPGTERVVSSSDASFGSLVLASVPSWRYEPAMLNGTAVRQIVRERQRLAAVATTTVGRTATPPGRSAIPPGCR